MNIPKSVRKLLSKCIFKAGHVAIRFAPKVYFEPPLGVSPQQQAILDRWWSDDGDKTRRLDYDLNQDSLVFDLGGYEGKWASDIYCKYSCAIHVFEPVEDFAKKIRGRFSPNAKIHVHCLGLSNSNASVPMNVDRDSSSAFKSGKSAVTIQLVRAAEFLEAHGIRQIDLLKVNIEGGEYDLLDHLIETGFVANIRDLQVQFHDFFPNADSRMRNIQEQLARTHRLTYQYPFVWENWRRIALAPSMPSQVS